MQGRASRLALTGALVLVGLGVAAGFACRRWLPQVASRHGEGIDAVLAYLLLATGTLFLAGQGALACLVWRFSAGGPPRAYPSPRTERRAAWAIVLLMCVVAEGGVIVVGMPAFHEIFGAPPGDALEVEVVGKQFEWIVRYPGPDGRFGRVDPALVHDVQNPAGLDEEDPDAQDDVVKRGALHLPVGRTVVLRLRALDVIHSFTIPEFRTKQDLVPGFLAHTSFHPTRLGEFEIACAELCGLGHYRMRGFATVESAPDFERWLGEQEPWI